MITNTSNNYTITTSTTASQAPKAYFSTLDAAFVYIREYIEDNIGENISVCVKETTLCINGKEQDLYEVSFNTAPQSITIPYTPYTPYVPQIPYDPHDEWWRTPTIYCYGSVPKVTLNEGAVGSDSAQQTKVGCIVQSYEAGAAPQA